MDPIATLRIINDETEDIDIRNAHVHYLAEWIAKGGAVPNTGEHIADGAWLTGSTYETAAAINAAIVNADLSGLDGLGYTVIR